MLLIATFTSAAAVAGEDYIETGSPVFAQADAGRAVVYFVRPGRTASFKRADGIYVDAAAVAWLPKNSYTSVAVAPGLRFVWWTVFGSLDGEWFSFKAGNTYLLRALPGSGAWYFDDPARVRQLVEEFALTYVTSTAAGLAKLEQQGAPQYERLRTKSWLHLQSEVASVELVPGQLLPLSVARVACKEKLGKVGEPGYWGNYGELTVDRTWVRWHSKRSELEIPVHDIREISFAGLSFRGQAAWIEVRYGATSATRQVFFHSPTNFGFLSSYNRKFAALAEALTANGRSSMP